MGKKLVLLGSLCVFLSLDAYAALIENSLPEESYQMPVAMTLASGIEDIIEKKDIVIGGNPFTDSSGVVFLNDIPDGGIEKLLEGTDLQILNSLFTPDGIDVPVEPINWNTDEQTIVYKVSNGDLVIRNSGVNAAFTIKTCGNDEVNRLTSQPEYFAFYIRPTINKDFKMRLFFYDPELNTTYTKEIHFGNLLEDWRTKLVVLRLDRLFYVPRNILLSIDFRLAKARGPISFPDETAATFSNFCFIGK